MSFLLENLPSGVPVADLVLEPVQVDHIARCFAIAAWWGRAGATACAFVRLCVVFAVLGGLSPFQPPVDLVGLGVSPLAHSVLETG